MSADEITAFLRVNRTLGVAVFVRITVGIVALSACSGDYLHVVSSYAKVNTRSVATLSTLPATLSAVCHGLERASYVRARLDRETTQAEPDYRTTPTTPNATQNGQPWTAACGDIAKVASTYAAGLQVLTTYYGALDALATSGQWDGSQVKTLADAGVTVVGSSTTIGEIMSALVGSTQRIAVAVVAHYTQGKICDLVANAPVRPALTKFGDYLREVDHGVVAKAATERRAAIVQLETGKLSPAELVTMLQYQATEEREIAEAEAMIRRDRWLVDAMDSGQVTLEATDDVEAIQAATTDIEAVLSASGNH